MSTPVSLRLCCSRFATSESRNGRNASLPSISVTEQPSSARIEAYSQPIGPPPTIARRRGMQFACMKRVGIVDALDLAVEGLRPVGARAAGDQDHLGREQGRRPPQMLDLDRVRIDEGGMAGKDVDVVVVEVARDLEAEVAHQRVLLRHEIPQRRALLELDVDAAQVARPKAGEIERRLAQRLERDAGVAHRAAERRALLDERDPLAEIGRLRGRLLAGDAAADHDQIVSHRGTPQPADRIAGRLHRAQGELGRTTGDVKMVGAAERTPDGAGWWQRRTA